MQAYAWLVLLARASPCRIVRANACKHVGCMHNLTALTHAPPRLQDSQVWVRDDGLEAVGGSFKGGYGGTGSAHNFAVAQAQVQQ